MVTVDAIRLPPHAAARSTFALWGGKATVVVSERSRLDGAVSEVRRIVDAFDDTCSSFRKDSELALLNNSAGQPVVVSSLLFSAVRTALRAARATHGAVDPTVGQALAAHGLIPRPCSGGAARIDRMSRYAGVMLDAAAVTVQLPRGVWLDLGATAKALAADMAARAAVSAVGCGVLVSLCGDVATAGEPPGRGWQIRVVEDHRRGDTPGQTVTIADGGLATSSVTVRRDHAHAVHHLIDPATGRPTAGPWRTATAAASSCVDANTASTAAIVLGARAPAWLERQWLPARLVGADSRVRHVGGWPIGGDDLRPSP